MYAKYVCCAMYVCLQLFQVRALLPIALPRNIAPADKFKKGLENVWGFTTADMCASESDILKVNASTEAIAMTSNSCIVQIRHVQFANALCTWC
jgi:hypothetical protein